MKRLITVALAAATMTAASAAWADWSVGGGFESFRWRESTAPSVKESGLRWALDLTWVQSKEPGLSAGYNLKLYNGNVDYTGATLFGGVPVSDDTHYRGMINEFQALYRMPNSVDAVIALGWDRWSRKNNDVTEEDWNVLYAKIGANVNAATKRGVFGSAGVKFPTWTSEKANFPALGATSNPKLRPGKDFSLYGSLGYRVNPSWDVIMYYDSYRFKESNVVAVPLLGGTAGFFQPKSTMDVLGMKVQHNF